MRYFRSFLYNTYLTHTHTHTRLLPKTTKEKKQRERTARLGAYKLVKNEEDSVTANTHRKKKGEEKRRFHE
jgi:hypothetical protein